MIKRKGDGQIMKPNAIIYTSNTGYTKQYADLLGEKTRLPVYNLTEAEVKVPTGTPVIYLGWLMAGKIQGYGKATKTYRIEALCGVGMGATGSQIEEIQRINHLSEDLPVFTVQGGFDMNKLHGAYKVMMTIMKRTAGKALKEKADRTSEEDMMLHMLNHGGNQVSEENLADILDWYGWERCIA